MAEQRERLQATLGVTKPPLPGRALAQARTVYGRSNPQQFKGPQPPVPPRCPQALHYSVMAGLRKRHGACWARIVRAMQHAALVGQGVTGMYARPGDR